MGIDLHITHINTLTHIKWKHTIYNITGQRNVTTIKYMFSRLCRATWTQFIV